MSERKPLGLLGGAFDPVHVTHINMALRCVEILDVQEVKFIPANLPPHKPGPVAAQQHRLAMLARAVRPYPQLTIEDMELKRGGVSYTVDTLAHLREKHARQPFCFIMGMDAFVSLPTWRRWQDLVNYVHLVLIDRKDQPKLRPDEGMQAYYAAHACSSLAPLHENPGGYIYKTSLSVPAISSSQIRDLLGKDENAAALLPPGVYRYIKENHLYI